MQVLGEQLARRGPAGEALRPLAERTLADVRSRVIFRCQAFIKEEVGGRGQLESVIAGIIKEG